MMSFSELREGISKPVSMAHVVKVMGSARSTIVSKTITPSNLAKAVQKAVGRTFGVEVTVKYASALKAVRAWDTHTHTTQDTRTQTHTHTHTHRHTDTQTHTEHTNTHGHEC